MFQMPIIQLYSLPYWNRSHPALFQGLVTLAYIVCVIQWNVLESNFIFVTYRNKDDDTFFGCGSNLTVNQSLYNMRYSKASKDMLGPRSK